MCNLIFIEFYDNLHFHDGGKVLGIQYIYIFVVFMIVTIHYCRGFMLGSKLAVVPASYTINGDEDE